jgi:hypothetical protein
MHPHRCRSACRKQPYSPNGPTAQRPNGPTAQRPNDPTAQRPNGPTTQRPNGPTAQRPNGPTDQQPNVAHAEGQRLRKHQHRPGRNSYLATHIDRHAAPSLCIAAPRIATLNISCLASPARPECNVTHARRRRCTPPPTHQSGWRIAGLLPATASSKVRLSVPTRKQYERVRLSEAAQSPWYVARSLSASRQQRSARLPPQEADPATPLEKIPPRTWEP